MRYLFGVGILKRSVSTHAGIQPLKVLRLLRHLSPLARKLEIQEPAIKIIRRNSGALTFRRPLPTRLAGSVKIDARQLLAVGKDDALAFYIDSGGLPVTVAAVLEELQREPGSLRDVFPQVCGKAREGAARQS